MDGIIKMINKIKSWTDNIPAKPSRTRFGNESFGIWYDRLKEVIYYKCSILYVHVCSKLG